MQLDVMTKFKYTPSLMQDKKLTQLLFGISTLIFIGLLWFIYVKPTATTTLPFVSLLPLFNAIFNTLCTICIIAGVYFIINKRPNEHAQFMSVALVFSALFLVSYLLYHHFHGDVPFTAQGLIRPIYFFILISHIIMTFFGLPMILITVTWALLNKISLHKKIARWTVPIWLYISVTGVLIYLFQVIWNH